MRKNTLLLLAAALFAVSTPANAQLGKLINKAKNAVTKVNEFIQPEKQTTNTQPEEKPTGAVTQLPGGGTMVNPLTSHFDFEFIGLYGRSTSLNTGDVFAVIKVTAKQPQYGVSFGSDHGNYGRTTAIGEDGVVYKTKSSISQSRNIHEGIPVKITFDDGLLIKDVSRQNKKMATIKYMITTRDDQWKLLELNDVPIQWDVEPDDAIVASAQPPTGAPLLINPLQDIFSAELVGVYGKSTSELRGNVYAVLNVKMKKNQSSISFGGDFGSSGETQAVDFDGNLYRVVRNITDSKEVAEGVTVKVVLDENSAIKDVPKTVKGLAAMRICVRPNEGSVGFINIFNAPIEWDKE